MTGNINMGDSMITNVTPGSDVDNAATLGYVRNQSIKHLPLDGTRYMIGNLNMGSNEIKALGNPTTDRSAVHKEWVIGMLNRPVTGLNIADDIDMKTHEIKNLGDPTTNKSAVSKGWFTSNTQHLAFTTGFTMLGDITMSNHKITSLPLPAGVTDAVNKKWITYHVSGSCVNSSGFTMTGDIDMGGHK